MKDLLRIAHSTLNAIDIRVLPTSLAVQVRTTCKLIEQELTPAPVVKKVAKKPAKKKAKKKVSKKK